MAPGDVDEDDGAPPSPPSPPTSTTHECPPAPAAAAGGPPAAASSSTSSLFADVLRRRRIISEGESAGDAPPSDALPAAPASADSDSPPPSPTTLPSASPDANAAAPPPSDAPDLPMADPACALSQAVQSSSERLAALIARDAAAHATPAATTDNADPRNNPTRPTTAVAESPDSSDSEAEQAPAGSHQLHPPQQQPSTEGPPSSSSSSSTSTRSSGHNSPSTGRRAELPTAPEHAQPTAPVDGAASDADTHLNKDKDKDMPAGEEMLGEVGEEDEDEDELTDLAELIADSEDGGLLALPYSKRLAVAVTSMGWTLIPLLAALGLLLLLTWTLQRWRPDSTIYGASLASWGVFLMVAVLLYQVARALAWMVVGLTLLLTMFRPDKPRRQLYLYNLQPPGAYFLWSILVLIAWFVVFDVVQPFPARTPSGVEKTLNDGADWIERLLGVNVGLGVLVVIESLVATRVNLRRRIDGYEEKVRAAAADADVLAKITSDLPRDVFREDWRVPEIQPRNLTAEDAALKIQAFMRRLAEQRAMRSRKKRPTLANPPGIVSLDLDEVLAGRERLLVDGNGAANGHGSSGRASVGLGEGGFQPGRRRSRPPSPNPAAMAAAESGQAAQPQAASAPATAAQAPPPPPPPPPGALYHPPAPNPRLVRALLATEEKMARMPAPPPPAKRVYPKKVTHVSVFPNARRPSQGQSSAREGRPSYQSTAAPHEGRGSDWPSRPSVSAGSPMHTAGAMHRKDSHSSLHTSAGQAAGSPTVDGRSARNRRTRTVSTKSHVSINSNSSPKASPRNSSRLAVPPARQTSNLRESDNASFNASVYERMSRLSGRSASGADGDDAEEILVDDGLIEEDESTTDAVHLLLQAEQIRRRYIEVCAGTKGIKSRKDAVRLGEAIFAQYRSRHRPDTVKVKKMIRHLPQAVGERVQAFFDPEGHGRITRDHIVERCEQAYHDRKNLSLTLADLASLMASLRRFLYAGIAVAVFVIVSLVFSQGAYAEITVTLGTTLLGLSFAFSQSVSNLFLSFQLLFVRVPYDVGDCVFFNDGTRAYVKQIKLSTTTFRHWNGTVFTISNHVLYNMRIDNWSKSGGQQAEIFMHLPFNTPVWKLKLLEDAFYELLDKKPHIYNSKASDFFLSDIVDLNRLKVVFFVQNRGNWSQSQHLPRRHEVLLGIKIAAEKLGLEILQNPQPVSITFDNQLSTVTRTRAASAAHPTTTISDEPPTSSW